MKRLLTLVTLVIVVVSFTVPVMADGPAAPLTFAVSDEVNQMTEVQKMRALIDLERQYLYDWLNAPVLDEDGKVGMVQFSLIAAHYGQTQDDPNWDQRADLLPDGKINLTDLMVLELSWGWNPDTNHDGSIQLIDMLMYIRWHLR